MNDKENLYTPKQVLERYMTGCISRTSAPWWRICLLGIMAGAFIAFGAAASSVSMYGIPVTGLSRTVGGAVFPIGLMLIILVGGELFTGDDNELGAYVIKVAAGKLNIPFGTAFLSGILCNILVCAAVFMAAGATDVTGKLWATFFPIFVFVICGFEHCVANMYYLTAGILAAGNDAYAAKATALYGSDVVDRLISHGWIDMLTKNLLPVTIGNMVGGMVCVGLPVYILYHDKKKGKKSA